MRVLRASIENFRGIRSADIRFQSHALIVGPNNACKSTILEALDMILGPDRAARIDAIDEHDFFRGRYKTAPGAPIAAAPDDEEEESVGGPEEDGANEEEDSSDQKWRPEEAGDTEEEGPVERERPEIRMEVTLGELSESECQRFRNYLEPWEPEQQRICKPEEAEAQDPEELIFVLRVGFRGWYEPEQDEFRTTTFFVNSPVAADGRKQRCGRRQKQAIGFLYLRSLRTGRRAATLQRGSLLDILLRERTSRPRLWETILDGLKETGRALEKNEEIRGALDQIQERIEGLIPLAEAEEEAASALRPGRLTRRHLRETITYFLASRDSAHPLPFDRLGSGTSNVLVFALLSAIADARENVIFAMEEPEIALPPHTQRVIVQRLKNISSQAILTSHSPYVAELFLPSDLVVVGREEDGELHTAQPEVGRGVKEKTLRRKFRTRFAEGLLARTVVVVEGITEFWGLPEAVDVLARTTKTAFDTFDLDGVVFIPADGSGELAKLATYFSSLGIRPIIVCDQLDDAERFGIEASTDLVVEHPYSGFEDQVAEELPLEALKRISREWIGWDDYPRHLVQPEDGAEEKEWRDYFSHVLRARKGEGYAARVLARCAPDELPQSVVETIAQIREWVGRPPLPADDPLAPLFGAAEERTDRPGEQADPQGYAP